MEQTAISHEFDWSNVIVLLAMISGYVLNGFRTYILNRQKTIEKTTEQEISKKSLDDKVDGLETRLSNFEIETKRELGLLDKKIEMKNDSISKQIQELDKKWDSKFDNLTKEIIELVKGK